MYEMKNFAIIVAAGKGLRMESGTKKQYLCLDGIPVLARTIMAFEKCYQINEIILVIPKDDKEYCKAVIIDPYGFEKKIHLVEGGKERQASVYKGLGKVRDIIKLGEKAIVLIHDGVRPFVPESIIKDCIENAIKYDACIPVVKISDTIKKITHDLIIEKTLDRKFLCNAQTPQAFKVDVILQAFEYALKTSFSGTDDASLVEHSGQRVVVIKGSKLNIKITTPEDLVLGEHILKK